MLQPPAIRFEALSWKPFTFQINPIGLGGAIAMRKGLQSSSSTLTCLQNVIQASL